VEEVRLDAPYDPTPVVPPLPQRPSRVVLIVLATGMAVVLILAVGTAWVLYQGFAIRGSRLVEVLSRGQTIFDVPVMTLCTAPRIPGETVESNVRWEVRSTNAGPSTTYLYDWRTLSGSSLPVRFVFNTTSLIQSGLFDRGSTEGTVLFHPAGPCGAGCRYAGWAQEMGGAGFTEVAYNKWNVTYTVYRVTDTWGADRTKSLLVDFSVVATGQFGDSLPAANVTAPGPADLALIATESLRSGESISIAARVAQENSPAPLTEFLHNGTPIALDAGPEGTLMVQLVSHYRWSPVDDYIVSFSASSNTTIQYFFDLRFGSITVRYV